MRRSQKWGITIVKLLLGGSLFSPTAVVAQTFSSGIVPDASLGAETSQVFSNLQLDRITGGALRSNALFHSFREFNIAAGRSAYFISPTPLIQTIFARVTGETQSNLFGRLGVEGGNQPTLVLINPKGILFGQGFSLDVAGSFFATTADAITLSNGQTFSATNPQALPLLVIQPTALFQVGSIPSGSAIVTQSTLSPGKDLQLVADHLDIQGAIQTNGSVILSSRGDISTRRIITNGGSIDLSSSAGSVDTNGDFLDTSSTTNAGGNLSIRANRSITAGDLLTFSTQGNAGAIQLSAGNQINVGNLTARSGATSGNGGIITLRSLNGGIQAKEIASTASSDSGQAGNGGNIDIKVANGNFAATFIESYAASDIASVGNAGSISIEVDRGNITTGFIKSAANASLNGIGFTTGNAGDIRILATQGNITTTSLESYTYSAYDPSVEGLAIRSGDIQVSSPNGEISLQGRAISFSSNGSGGSIHLSSKADLQLPTLNTTGQRTSGSITISSQGIVTGTNAILATDTFGAGRGGDVRISGKSIILSEGAQISATTHANGFGGDIHLTAADAIVLTGKSFTLPTSEDLFAASGVTEQGNISVFLPTGDPRQQDFSKATLFPSGLFTQTTVESTGNAGSITLSSPRLVIQDQAAIATTTFGSGNGGNIRINSSQGKVLVSNGSISSGVAAGATGNSGILEINARSLEIDNQGLLRTQTLGEGRAGAIQINVDNTVLRRNSKILTTSDLSNAGDIQLNSTTIVALEDSDILAFAPIGRGGNIRFTTTAFLSNPLFRSTPAIRDRAALNQLLTNRQVDVNASGAVSGEISGVPNITFLQNSLTSLNQTTIDTNTLLANSCIVRNQQNGSFYITGTGGLPTNPIEFSAYPTGTVQPAWKRGDAIVEPQGVYQLPNGQLIMSRECD